MSVPDVNQLLDFSDTVVVVTGASGEIGAGVALRFAQAGANVVAHYRTDATNAEVIVEAVQQMGRRALAIRADLTDPEEVSDLFYETEKAFGQVSVLVNNAGVFPVVPLLEMTPTQWDEVLNANLRSVFLCTQAAARQMKTQADDLNAIVNIASIEADSPGEAHSHYVASKQGVIGHTRAAALELGAYGIRVNAVSPGLITREGIREGFAEGVAAWERNAPLARMGQPDDIADACLFLASRAARWVTGVNVRVDGGMNVRALFG